MEPREETGREGLGSRLTGCPVRRTVCAAFRENTDRWNRWHGQGGLPTAPPDQALCWPLLLGVQATPPPAHLYLGCSEVSEGDRSGMDRDVEDRVVAMEAVVASSKEGGVQGRRSGRPVEEAVGSCGSQTPRTCCRDSPLLQLPRVTPVFPAQGFQYLPAALKLKSKLPPCSPALVTSPSRSLRCNHRPPYSSSNTPGTVLPQDLCARSFSLELLPSPSLTGISDPCCLEGPPEHQAQLH